MKILNKKITLLVFFLATFLVCKSYAENLILDGNKIEFLENETENKDEFIKMLEFLTEEKTETEVDGSVKKIEAIEGNEEVIVIPKLKVKNINEENKTNTITIQALNKITAKSYEYEIKIGATMQFERLSITPLFCWKSSPFEIKENKALINIVENKINKETEELFYGWMFSSSPSISSLQHPMYDVKVVDCEYINYEEVLEE